ncbi:MAG: PAS domain S-box protein [Candidatus Eisenbacteria bacterium]|nr:PAS domain S-box protein [Candidatus Eisenbacteria bacterium]
MAPAHGDAGLPALAFDLAPSGMLAVDDCGRIVAANREAERLFGWPEGGLIGQSADVLVPDAARAAHAADRASFMRDPQRRAMGAGRDLRGRRRDGSEFPVEIGLNPVRTAEGVFVLASVVDITERRRLEDELRRSQRLETIGVLAGGIAHDFNNILLGIVGHTELTLREPRLPADAREDLGLVLQAAERGRQLVHRILAFSRDGRAVRRPVRLDRTVEEAAGLLRGSLPSTVEIRARLDPATPDVLGDETQIHQVLMNLVTNAAQAMPSGGAIDIELAPLEVGPGRAGAGPALKPGRYARLVVRDAGTGMAPDVLEHALEPFYTTKAPGQGTGLGLSVVHGIVTSHGGTLLIDSAPGRGTTVTVLLPASAAAKAAEAAAAAPAGPARQVHILLVDDEATLARMQRRQLEHLGYAVTVHTSSPEALEAFRADPTRFDLLITDDTMPRMTGTMLAGEMLRLRPDLPVLMVSGGDRADPEKARPNGVRKVLLKPHTIDELERAIVDVLGSEPRG